MISNLIVWMCLALPEKEPMIATQEKNLPPIDRAVPKKTETALFALG